MSTIKRNEPAFIRLLGGFVDWATILMGATIVALVFTNVMLHLFGRDIAWTTEVSEMLMVWTTFVGGAAATRRGEHVAITEVIDRLGPKARHCVEVLIQLVIIGILVLLIWYGASITESAWNDHSSVLDWPMSFVYAAVPVASILTLIFVLYELSLVLRGVPRDERFGE